MLEETPIRQPDLGSGPPEHACRSACGTGEPRATPLPRAAWWRRPALALGVATALTVAINLYWVSARRRGLPLTIDEAGYLQRAIRDSDALHAGGLVGLVHAVRGPDIQAPLLPVTAGAVHYVTGLGPSGLIGVQQLFAVILAVSVYLVARRLMSRNWAALASLVVLVLPGVLDQGRDFGFALAADAMLTAALAAQLGAADFRSTPRTLLWGGVLGLAALSRTEDLALILVLVLAAGLRVFGSGPTRRKVGNVAAALLLGFLIVWTWYSASWRTVFHYLTSYGYGSNAARYGAAHPIWSLQWWTNRLTQMVNTDVFLPLTAALALCLVIGIAGETRRRRRRPQGSSGPESPAALERVRRWLGSDMATVVIYFVGSYLFLSSTRNDGWGFEVPLLTPAVILILAGLRRAPRRGRRLAATACCVAVAFSVVAQSGILPGNFAVLRTVGLGPWHAPVLDSRGITLLYTQSRLPSCAAVLDQVPAARGLTCAAYAAEWGTAAQQGARMVWADATARGRLPVLRFATQDRFFNTNTVDLDFQLAEHRELGLGLIAPATEAESSVAQQLDNANLVFAGPASTVPWWTLAPTVPDRLITVALRQDGFTEIDRLVLPDSRTMGLWWKDQGPAAPSPKR